MPKSEPSASDYLPLFRCMNCKLHRSERAVHSEPATTKRFSTTSSVHSASFVLVSHMQTVTGIGGLCFRAKEPEALGHWYKKHLGIDLVPSDYNQKLWSQEAGLTAFAPFPADAEYFGKRE